MTISLTEFLSRISDPKSDLYLLVCTEVIVYDHNTKNVYVPVTTHGNNNMHPMVDFKTYLGHGLLWSRHTELDCTSQELNEALAGNQYVIAPYQGNDSFKIYTMKKRVIAAAA
jgi:hypothetical protein